jgi:hypothetical protein
LTIWHGASGFVRGPWKRLREISLNFEIPPRVWASFAQPDAWDTSAVIDWKRRIATTYGLARDYGVLCSREQWDPNWKQLLLSIEESQVVALPDGNWSSGWNKTLLSNAGPLPEIAAERILKRVSELARARNLSSK